jgi:hypothetical protein
MDKGQTSDFICIVRDSAGAVSITGLDTSDGGRRTARESSRALSTRLSLR